MTAGRDADRLRTLLDARTIALAERRSDRRVRDTRTYLVCACATERVGLPVEACAAVMPARACTPVPNAPPVLRGIIALSGGIVSVIDLARLLGLPDGYGTEPVGDGSGHFLRLRDADPPVVLAVDRVLGVSEIDVADLVGLADVSPLGAHAVSGYAPPTGGAAIGFTILDLPRLMRTIPS